MTSTGDPFTQASGDPFAAQDFPTGHPTGHVGPPISYGGPTTHASTSQAAASLESSRKLDDARQGDHFAEGANWPTAAPWPAPTPEPPLNTYAVLAPIFGVVVPPAGIAFGHLALPQIKRTGERGWLAAVVGLVLGYLLSVVLVAVLIWLFAGGGRGPGNTDVPRSSATSPWPSVVTSIAPAPTRPRHKLDWSQATVGKCAEIEKRDEAHDLGQDDALDLYEVPCQHRVGVYTIVARVPIDAECNSTYVAAPPDRSFAVCLNRY